MSKNLERTLIVVSDAAAKTSKGLMIATLVVFGIGLGASIWADKLEFKRYKRSIEEANNDNNKNRRRHEK